VAEFTKNTGQHDVGRWELWSCDETTAEKGHPFVAFTKKVASFLGENWGDTRQLPPRVTPTLVTPLARKSTYRKACTKCTY